MRSCNTPQPAWRNPDGEGCTAQLPPELLPCLGSEGSWLERPAPMLMLHQMRFTSTCGYFMWPDLL